MASSSSYNSPCAACKFLRRKCTRGCLFAPFFPPEEPHKFANVHKIFGASNVSKLLSDLQPHQREDAVHSLAYEAEARIRDPVYGCVGAISFLQRQVDCLQKELEVANAELIRYARNVMPVVPCLSLIQRVTPRERAMADHLAARRINGGMIGDGGYHCVNHRWNGHNPSDSRAGGGGGGGSNM